MQLLQIISKDFLIQGMLELFPKNSFKFFSEFRGIFQKKKNRVEILQEIQGKFYKGTPARFSEKKNFVRIPSISLKDSHCEYME